MSEIKIFVSSTCYDLSQLREDIRTLILNLGHEPLLSEYPSFPVHPDLKAIDNCKKVVKEQADIFLLIVGGKRGSLDPDSGKPITNLEYDTAKDFGIQAFVFVKRSILDFLPVWENNPTTNFEPHVNNPEVFAFIKRLQAEQQWLFSFDKASEIAEILKCQLSVLFKDLLQRKREGRLHPHQAFIGESPHAQQLVADRPKFWGFLLAEELLRSKLKEVNRRFDELNRGSVYNPSKVISASEFFGWGQAKMNDLLALMHLFTVSLTQELATSWGPLGSAGDPVEIKMVVDKIIDGCNELFNWEVDLRATFPPDPLEKIKKQMYGWTLICLDEIARVPEEIAKILSQPNPRGTYTINLVFEAPPGIEELGDELNRLGQHPEEFL